MKKYIEPELIKTVYSLNCDIATISGTPNLGGDEEEDEVTAPPVGV